jgi:predicted NodU family carbamoyl transferase
MNIPGVSGAVGHAASAALFVDGQLVAAVEEERFLRDKHARGRFPLLSSRYCLEDALNMFYESDLEYLIMEDVLVRKFAGQYG